MLTLVIGNKNYSSWSLRPWLALKQAGIPFEEVMVDLYAGDAKAQLARHSPSGRVSALIDGALTVWDSIAICEYAAEIEPSLWPQDRAARATARAVSAEMHSGFAALRSKMPMDCQARLPGAGRTPDSEKDIARIAALWEECRGRHGADGPFLFGRFSIADAMYAPVVWRFRSYGVELPAVARDYADTMEALPAMQDWRAAALAEPAKEGG
jgi:glutathione S-transferase